MYKSYMYTFISFGPYIHTLTHIRTRTHKYWGKNRIRVTVREIFIACSIGSRILCIYNFAKFVILFFQNCNMSQQCLYVASLPAYAQKIVDSLSY